MADNKLHTAVRYGNEEETLQALKEGFNPNEIGMLRWSPVHEASHNGERDILKLLLLFKGDVNQKDGLHGNTPLHYAAQEDNSACVTVLLKAGAKLDMKNDQGRTPMDIATSSCLERMEPFFNNSQNTAGEEWQPGGAKPLQRQGSGDQTQGQWEGLNVPSAAAIGSLHLSFEFHKNTLKARVWQITDLLLPPPQTSMIESIFVRGYFIPDPAKKSLRKTEDVPVDPHGKDTTRHRPNSSQLGGIQHIFTPSSFRFDSPLLYTGVTDEIVSQRSIQLEVCMTQKHTHKPFLMAMVHMPLRTAVRRPIREKYPLIPCMNYTIPNSMRVYSAKDIFVEGTSEAVSVNLSRSNSLQSNPDSTLSSSDVSVTLQDVCVENVPVKSHTRKLISVNISDSCEDEEIVNYKKENNEDGDEEEDVDDGIGSSLDVKICSGKGSASSSVTVDVLDTSLNEPDSNSSNTDLDLKDVVIHRSESVYKETSVVDMDKVSHSLAPEAGGNRKKRIIPNELLVKSQDDDEEGDGSGEDLKCGQISRINSESTVIEVEDPVKETVVDMTRLGKDTVLDIDLMTDSGYDNESVQSESPMSETKESKEFKRKKRIIPIEVNGGCSVEEEENDDTVINESEKISAFDDNEDEISSEISSTRLQSSSSQISTDSSKEKSSTPVAGSRPETPVWDFYDFAGQGSGTNPNDQQSAVTNSSSTPDTTVSFPNKMSSSTSVDTTTSTLQESLARLSRPQPVLDTCLVSGPVLPSVMVMEDFEMDEES